MPTSSAEGLITIGMIIATWLRYQPFWNKIPKISKKFRKFEKNPKNFRPIPTVFWKIPLNTKRIRKNSTSVSLSSGQFFRKRAPVVVLRSSYFAVLLRVKLRIWVFVILFEVWLLWLECYSKSRFIYSSDESYIEFSWILLIIHQVWFGHIWFIMSKRILTNSDHQYSYVSLTESYWVIVLVWILCYPCMRYYSYSDNLECKIDNDVIQHPSPPT